MVLEENVCTTHSSRGFGNVKVINESVWCVRKTDGSTRVCGAWESWLRPSSVLGGYNGVSFLLASCISPTRPSCLVNSEKLQTHPFLFCSRSCRITMAEGVERDEQPLFRGHPAQPVVAGKYLHLQHQTYILEFWMNVSSMYSNNQRLGLLQ